MPWKVTGNQQMPDQGMPFKREKSLFLFFQRGKNHPSEHRRDALQNERNYAWAKKKKKSILQKY